MVYLVLTLYWGILGSVPRVSHELLIKKKNYEEVTSIIFILLMNEQR